VRITTVFRRLLAVTSMLVDHVRLEDDGLVLDVRPRWRFPRCGECGHRAPGFDRKAARRWRALSFGSTRVHLSYRPRRVQCARCGGVRVEKVPWAAHASWFTYRFEELVAYLVQVTDKTKVTELMGIAWDTVGNIVARVVRERLDPGRLDRLRRIGIDEFSYRKYHRYVTVVVDHDTHRVVWAREGRGAEVLAAFLDELGKERLAQLELATIDMSAGFKKALREKAPHVEVVFDRFHVQRLASHAVDEVRRALWRELEGTEEGDEIKNSRYALLKNPWNLTRTQRQKLRDVQRNNRVLYRAYLLKETLARALDYRQPWRASKAIDEWLSWASRSKLAPFVRVARTVRAHKEGILGYVRHRLTNGVVEGINTRLRMVARRAFGFHSAAPLIAMFHLVTGRITLTPPLP
jgi:transposase